MLSSPRPPYPRQPPRPTGPNPKEQQAIPVIRNTQTQLDRIKEALRRIRIDNPNLSTEESAATKERLTQRARDLITNTRSVSYRIQYLHPRLNARSELLNQAQVLRNTRQDPAKAKTGRDRE